MPAVGEYDCVIRKWSLFKCANIMWQLTNVPTHFQCSHTNVFILRWPPTTKSLQCETSLRVQHTCQTKFELFIKKNIYLLYKKYKCFFFECSVEFWERKVFVDNTSNYLLYSIHTYILLLAISLRTTVNTGLMA